MTAKKVCRWLGWWVTAGKGRCRAQGPGKHSHEEKSGRQQGCAAQHSALCQKASGTGEVGLLLWKCHVLACMQVADCGRRQHETPCCQGFGKNGERVQKRSAEIIMDEAHSQPGHPIQVPGERRRGSPLRQAVLLHRLRLHLWLKRSAPRRLRRGAVVLPCAIAGWGPCGGGQGRRRAQAGRTV